MLDLRTHIASLIAVFLALAVGIVVGIPLGSSERQMGAMHALQTQLREAMAEDRKIQGENSQLRARLAVRDEAIRRLALPVAQERLAGQRVAILICGSGERPGYLPALQEMVRVAGAQVISVTRVPTPFGPVPETARRSLAAALATSGSNRRLDSAALDAVGVALASGDGFRRLRQIAPTVGIDLEGEYRLPARRLLILVAEPEPPAPEEMAGVEPRPLDRVEVAMRLARAAAAAGAAVVVGETEGSPPIQSLRGLADRGISTIDNIDSAAGQLALVLTLSGARGNWGAKAGSGRLLPPLEPVL